LFSARRLAAAAAWTPAVPAVPAVAAPRVGPAPWGAAALRVGPAALRVGPAALRGAA
jgi:hypothetical protein